jgi:N-acetylmuramoyl-L-alanine amidase
VKRTLVCSLLVALSGAPLGAQLPSLRIGDAAVPVERMQGGPAAPASALSALGAVVQLDGWRARVLLFGDTFNFASHSPFYRSRARTYQLATPAVRSATGLWLPLQFFIEHLPKAYPDRLAYQAGTLRLTRSTLAAAPDSARQPAASRAVPAPEPARAKPRPTQRVVVLDAGHGGRDPGKPGPNGLLEKSVALTIVNRLGGFLRERGYEVHLTRKTDTLISLADRPHRANTWKQGRPATVFVSIHANSHRSAATQGFETFFLSEARTDDERRVAEMENEAVQYEDGAPAPRASELDQIEYSLKNDFYLRASNSLAELIQRQLELSHPGPNRGVKQAGFRVLVGAVMPAVLVEVGFISNRAEARLLGTAAFQQKLAYSIAEAIDRFFRTHEHLFGAPSQ